MKFRLMLILLMCFSISLLFADEKHQKSTHSKPGENPWNSAQEPDDWWGAIERMHGHVGPWNVLGWRIGQQALEDFGSEWGRHELDITCHVPMSTPHSCLADGLVIGTGNSIGRLDIRLEKVDGVQDIYVSVKRKDDEGPAREYYPLVDYMKSIESRSVEELDALSKACRDKIASELFDVKTREK